MDRKGALDSSPVVVVSMISAMLIGSSFVTVVLLLLFSFFFFCSMGKKRRKAIERAGLELNHSSVVYPFLIPCSRRVQVLWCGASREGVVLYRSLFYLYCFFFVLLGAIRTMMFNIYAAASFHLRFDSIPTGGINIPTEQATGKLVIQRV
jgi:hypothetical protein